MGHVSDQLPQFDDGHICIFRSQPSSNILMVPIVNRARVATRKPLMTTQTSSGRGYDGAESHVMQAGGDCTCLSVQILIKMMEQNRSPEAKPLTRKHHDAF